MFNLYILSDVQAQCDEFSLSSNCFEKINHILWTNRRLIGEFIKPVFKININEFEAFI
jgi:hypothetical protein